MKRSLFAALVLLLPFTGALDAQEPGLPPEGMLCAAPAVQDPSAEPKAKCCFTNTAYTGVCEATPGTDETCASILTYLNTPNSTGKSYCGGTAVRGGWAQASCAPKPS